MNRTIGGVLTTDALATLAATSAGDELRRKQFFLLTRPAQIAAIQRLAESGMTDAAISRATGLSTEMICRLLSNTQRVMPQ